MAGAAPGNQQNLAFLQQYAQDPDKAVGTRKLTPAEQVEIAQAQQQQGAAHEGPEQGGSKPGRRENAGPQPPALGPGVDVPVQNIRGATARIPGVVVKLPTPGSLVFPLLVVVLFWILIIKVNGQSRIGWMWAVLTGNAAVTPSVTNVGTLQGATNANGSDQTNVAPIFGLVNTPTRVPTQLDNTINNGTFQNAAATPWLIPPVSGPIAATGEF